VIEPPHVGYKEGVGDGCTGRDIVVIIDENK